MTDKEELRRTYSIRFQGLEEYRNEIWKILVGNFFSRWIPVNSSVLDLGCGYGYLSIRASRVTKAKIIATDNNAAAIFQFS